ncbi:peptidase inhibitor 16 isoform X8 [Oxyura jamaicensis]|uniref:peptidase inhibitor 16 isoform X8 n=1 Tax=Oxyura jamaicensis TaxID=8884 RepID=UPI0015A567D9|nr:peptidase inhibitor 16 isoform X8 [Oxyura jamaicensis]
MLSTGLPPVFLLLTALELSWSLTDEEKRIILDGHNKYRSQVSPPAMDMLKMSWDTELEAFAQAYAEKCIWDHNKERGRRGENLFAMAPTLDLEFAVEDWNGEEKYYNLTTSVCVPGQMCGHYTQVVWASTHRIGCGAKFCEKIDGIETEDMYLLVCNYYPPGNVKGRKPYKEGPSCSQCPKGRVCVKSLCESTVEETTPTSVTTKKSPSTTPTPEPTTTSPTMATEKPELTTIAPTQTQVPTASIAKPKPTVPEPTIATGKPKLITLTTAMPKPNTATMAKPASTTPKPTTSTAKPAPTTPKPSTTTVKPSPTVPQPTTTTTTAKSAPTTPKPTTNTTTAKPAPTTTPQLTTTTIMAKPAPTMPQPTTTATMAKAAPTTSKPTMTTAKTAPTTPRPTTTMAKPAPTTTTTMAKSAPTMPKLTTAMAKPAPTPTMAKTKPSTAKPATISPTFTTILSKPTHTYTTSTKPNLATSTAKMLTKPTTTTKPERTETGRPNPTEATGLTLSFEPTLDVDYKIFPDVELNTGEPISLTTEDPALLESIGTAFSPKSVPEINKGVKEDGGEKSSFFSSPPPSFSKIIPEIKLGFNKTERITSSKSVVFSPEEPTFLRLTSSSKEKGQSPAFQSSLSADALAIEEWETNSDQKSMDQPTAGAPSNCWGLSLFLPSFILMGLLL